MLAELHKKFDPDRADGADLRDTTGPTDLPLATPALLRGPGRALGPLLKITNFFTTSRTSISDNQLAFR